VADAKVKVLLVEDNAINQMVASHTLRRAGCEVTTAPDGRKAVELFCVQPFDMVFMDCQMPEMDGFEAVAHIRAIEQREARTRMPVVALTAHALQGDRERCLAAGMDDYVPKPFPDGALEEALARWTGMVVQSPIKPPSTAVPHVEPEERTLDIVTLKELQTLLQERFHPLLKKYMEGMEQAFADIDLALDREDRTTVRNVAHTVKTSSAQVGALQLARTLEKMEAISEYSTTGIIKEILDAAIEHYSAVQAQIHKIVAK
jgi:CheY-like chemotaxis protein